MTYKDEQHYQDELIDAMSELDEEAVMKYVKAMLECGYTPDSIMMSLNIGMSCVGKYFEQGEFFIADLIVSGMIYRDALRILMPFSSDIKQMPVGRVVIGVAEGDIHDIGKDIVVDILRAEHFEVIDLGVDVKAERFAYAIKTYKPDVLLLSGVLSLAADGFEKVIKLLKEEGLRDSVKILIGGAISSPSLAEFLGADSWAYDPMETAEFCKMVIQSKKDGGK